jgi:hypothetical protein
MLCCVFASRSTNNFFTIAANTQHVDTLSFNFVRLSLIAFPRHFRVLSHLARDKRRFFSINLISSFIFFSFVAMIKLRGDLATQNSCEAASTETLIKNFPSLFSSLPLSDKYHKLFSLFSPSCRSEKNLVSRLMMARASLKDALMS